MLINPLLNNELDNGIGGGVREIISLANNIPIHFSR
jgi:hypothetical protein